MQANLVHPIVQIYNVTITSMHVEIYKLSNIYSNIIQASENVIS